MTVFFKMRREKENEKLHVLELKQFCRYRLNCNPTTNHIRARSLHNRKLFFCLRSTREKSKEHVQDADSELVLTIPHSNGLTTYTRDTWLYKNNLNGPTWVTNVITSKTCLEHVMVLHSRRML